MCKSLTMFELIRWRIGLLIIPISDFDGFMSRHVELLSTLRVNMEPVNLGYSTKNIPIAQPKDYLKCLVEKTESFLRCVRWKAYHFLKPTQPEAAKETFGFNTTKCPPLIKELEYSNASCFQSSKTSNLKTTTANSRMTSRRT